VNACLAAEPKTEDRLQSNYDPKPAGHRERDSPSGDTPMETLDPEAPALSRRITASVLDTVRTLVELSE
jgi:hypothetical protein